MTVTAVFFAGMIRVEAGRPRPPATQALVTSDILTDSSKKVKIVTEVTKDTDELDTSFDYYTIIARVYDLTRHGPATVRVMISVPSFVEEMDHWPEGGTFSRGQQCASLGAGIAGVSMSVPLCGGGGTITFVPSETTPNSLVRRFVWTHEYNDCGGVFTDKAEYGVLVRVPENAGLTAYTYAYMDWPYFLLQCQYGGWYEIYWGFATYGGGGGVDNYYATDPYASILKGVSDAPDSGAGLSMSSNAVGGIIYGWTGGGDRSLDLADYYQTTIPNGNRLTVRLYVNGANIDLCMDTWKGTYCSQNGGTTDETVSVINDAGASKTVTIRVVAVPPNYGQYELTANLDVPTMTVTIHTYEKSRGDPNPGYGSPASDDVYRDGVKIGTSDLNGLFVDHPLLGTHSYYAKTGTYSSGTQTASADSTLYLTILTPY